MSDDSTRAVGPICLPLLGAADARTPAQRALEHGAGALVDVELLSVLLGCTDVATARELLSRHLGLLGLVAGINTHGLVYDGLEPEGRARLLVACELARRIAGAELASDLELLDRPAVVAGYLYATYARAGLMTMGVLFLNDRLRLVGEHDLLRSGPPALRMNLKILLREALRADASQIILFEIRPDGTCAPSASDSDFSRQLSLAAEQVGLKLADHLIVAAPNQWYSYQQAGAL